MSKNIKPQTAAIAALITKATGVSNTIGAAIVEMNTPAKPRELPAVPKAVHTAILVSVASVQAVSKAQGGEFTALQALLMCALPLQADMALHAVVVADVNEAFKAADMMPSALIRVTLLNNARHLAYGKAATRNAAAIPAQSLELVLGKISAAVTITGLREVLALRPKAEKGAQLARVPSDTVEGVETEPLEKKPLTRAQVILLAIQTIERTFEVLKPGQDAVLIGKLAEAVKELKAA